MRPLCSWENVQVILEGEIKQTPGDAKGEITTNVHLVPFLSLSSAPSFLLLNLNSLNTAMIHTTLQTALVPGSIHHPEKYLCPHDLPTEQPRNKVKSIRVDCRQKRNSAFLPERSSAVTKPRLGRERWPPDGAHFVRKWLGDQQYRGQAEEWLFMDWEVWTLGCPGYRVLITVLFWQELKSPAWQVRL